VGYAFYWREFSLLTFTAPPLAWVWWLQAALLAALALWPGRVDFLVRRDAAGLAGLALLLLALFGFPLLDALAPPWLLGAASPGWQAARLPGMAPGPTALFTVGLLLHARGRAAPWLLGIPLLWCAVNAAMAWSLAMPGDAALSLAGPAAAGLALGRRRTGREARAVR
jgi:hypothetical protein